MTSMSAKIRSPLVPRALNVLVWAVSMLALLMAVASVFRGLVTGNAFNHVVGTWMTLARDLAQGIFYRPLVDSSIGYGGTRFVPLVFILQGLLIRGGMSVVAAGIVLTGVTALLFLAAVTALLWYRSIRWPLLLALIALTLTAPTIQVAFSAVRGDLLPLTCSVAGLLLALKGKGPSWTAFLVPALLFTLAFSGKITEVHGVATAALLFASQRRWHDALGLATLTAVGCAMTLGLIALGSGGRFFSIVSACASGGSGLAAVLAMPERFFHAIWIADRITGVSLGVAMVIAVGRRIARQTLAMEDILLPVTITITLVIFSSPGTATNHLADLHVASVLMIATLFHGRSLRDSVADRGGVLAVAAVLVLLLLGCKHTQFHLRYMTNRFAAIREVLSTLPPDGRPVLSEDPMVPLLADEPVCLLDAFMARIVAEKNAALAAPLLEDARAHRFRAVVLMRDPVAAHDSWYRKMHFGTRLIDGITAHYRFGHPVGGYVIGLPKEDP
jgi:hypothetical protein